MLRWASVIFWSRSFIIHHAASGRCVAICLGRARFTSVVILYWASSIVFPLSCVTHYPASDLCVVLRLSLLLFTMLHRLCRLLASVDHAADHALFIVLHCSSVFFSCWPSVIFLPLLYIVHCASLDLCVF